MKWPIICPVIVRSAIAYGSVISWSAVINTSTIVNGVGVVRTIIIGYNNPVMWVAISK
jgi:hypothetical protein